MRGKIACFVPDLEHAARVWRRKSPYQTSLWVATRRPLCERHIPDFDGICEDLAKEYSRAQDFLFLGRGYQPRREDHLSSRPLQLPAGGHMANAPNRTCLSLGLMQPDF